MEEEGRQERLMRAIEEGRYVVEASTLAEALLRAVALVHGKQQDTDRPEKKEPRSE